MLNRIPFIDLEQRIFANIPEYLIGYLPTSNAILPTGRYKSKWSDLLIKPKRYSMG